MSTPGFITATRVERSLDGAQRISEQRGALLLVPGTMELGRPRGDG